MVPVADEGVHVYQEIATHKDTNDHTNLNGCGQAYSTRGKCNMIRLVSLIAIVLHIQLVTINK